MKFSDLMKHRKEEAADIQSNIFKGIEENQRALAEISKEMRKAAENGDIELYNHLDEETRKTKNAIVVLKAQSNIRLDSSEISKTWIKAVEEYNKRYDMQYKKYIEAKAGLYNEFRKLAEIQNEGLKEAFGCPAEVGSKNELKQLDIDESRKVIKLLYGFISQKVLDNIETVFNGSFVDDIDKTATIDEMLEIQSLKRNEKIIRARAEADRRNRIVRDIASGKADISAIDWLDLDEMTALEKAEYIANIKMVENTLCVSLRRL